MNGAWHGGKGSKQRLPADAKNRKRELELRDLLWREKDLLKKEEIKKELLELLGKVDE